jgi:phospholipid transport system substrate-binding protein
MPLAIPLRSASRRRVLAGAILFVAGLATSCHALAQESAEGLIRRVVGEVTRAIDADPQVASGNRARVTALINERIVPHLDLEAMTRSAAGRHWNRATPEQQKALTTEFGRLLVNTYSGAFANYRPDTRIEFKPTRAAAPDEDTVVRTLVTARGGEPMSIDYVLERKGDAWKVTDINVLGARLVETYRNQFNDAIGRDGIDGLIRALAARNKALDARS